jgi:hypothetical protein
MKKLTTFEDIFNKLIEDYSGHTVQISSKQDGLNITDTKTKIRKVKIKPLNKKRSRKWNKNGKKVGLLIIKGKNFFKTTTINIPFLLGFNTMKAVFLKNGVTIKTYNMEFTIKKVSNEKKHTA